MDEGHSVSDIEDGAYHEAGHAVVAYLLDAYVYGCHITPDPATHSFGRTTINNRREDYPDVQSWAKTDVMISLGGAAAESIHSGVARPATARDAAEAIKAARQATGGKKTGAYLRRLYLETVLLLRNKRNWQAVEALTRRLLVVGRLEEEFAVFEVLFNALDDEYGLPMSDELVPAPRNLDRVANSCFDDCLRGERFENWMAEVDS